MTGHEHPISDEELDAVLGTAAARLDAALARAVDTEAGLAALIRANTAQVQISWSEVRSRPNDAPASAESAEQTPAESLNSISALIASILLLVKKFPASQRRLCRKIADPIAGLGPELKHLDEQLARRKLGRQEARAKLQTMNALLEQAAIRLAQVSSYTKPLSLSAMPRHAVAVMLGALTGLGTSSSMPNDGSLWRWVLPVAFSAVPPVFTIWNSRRTHTAVSRQIAALRVLRAHLNKLGVAVEKLFDDAEDRSDSPTGRR